MMMAVGVRDNLSSITLSVVIPNYNYADYVGAAIESALRIKWPKVEVVVVDDGSTDSSREVISSYSDDIIAIYQSNAGQVASCRNGFDRSSGDVVIFLDSDDVLHADVMVEIASSWSDRASKFQFQMRIIDAAGRPTGSILPQYLINPSPEDIRRWVERAASYPTPPGSGNAYPRWFVNYVFQFASDFVDRAPDSYLLSAAPALGDVVTIPRVLADYRVHGLNHGAALSLDDGRFSREVSLTKRRHKYFREIATSVGRAVDDGALNRNLQFLCLRAASFALRPDLHPIPADSAVSIFWRAISAVVHSQGYSRAQRAFLMGWIAAVVFCPAALSRVFVTWRYVPSSRPSWIVSLMRLAKIMKSN